MNRRDFIRALAVGALAPLVPVPKETFLRIEYWAGRGGNLVQAVDWAKLGSSSFAVILVLDNNGKITNGRYLFKDRSYCFVHSPSTAAKHNAKLDQLIKGVGGSL